MWFADTNIPDIAFAVICLNQVFADHLELFKAVRVFRVCQVSYVLCKEIRSIARCVKILETCRLSFTIVMELAYLKYLQGVDGFSLVTMTLCLADVLFSRARLARIFWHSHRTKFDSGQISELMHMSIVPPAVYTNMGLSNHNFTLPCLCAKLFCRIQVAPDWWVPSSYWVLLVW